MFCVLCSQFGEREIQELNDANLQLREFCLQVRSFDLISILCNTAVAIIVIRVVGI